MPSYQPRRICLLTTGLALGGAEAQVVFLAANLHRRGWAVSVVSMLTPEARTEELLAENIHLLNLRMKAGVPDVRAILRLAKYWRTFRPHIVHCHMVHANLLGRITRVVAPVPVLISTAHSIFEGRRSRDLAYRLTDSLSDLTTNVSRAGRERYANKRLASADKLIWVPNGIDTSLFAPDQAVRTHVRSSMGWNDDFVWLAVGNLREPKDYPNLLRAFAIVADGRDRCRLAIAGFGKLSEELLQLSTKLGIRNKVEFLGCRQDIRELLQGADAYVISSAWEGTPIALLEAAASELPAVGTKVGGNPEVIEDEKTGLLVPPRDPRALAAAMLRMVGLSEETRHAMGAAARARVETVYGKNRVLTTWENIYEQLLQEQSDKQIRSPLRILELGRRQL
jgi:glycosyltransferase involved in cell wall biosynthesis